MGLYDRDYAREHTASSYEYASRSESHIVSFVKETYKLFAASMLAGAAGAYAGMPFAATVAANYWFIALPWMLFGMFGLQMVKNKPVITSYSIHYTKLYEGKVHLGVGFPLRCFQRLSHPYVATQRCSWQNNWCTSGTSNPVLSY